MSRSNHPAPMSSQMDTGGTASASGPVHENNRSPAPRRRPHTRNRRGCLTCRKRHVRCSQAHEAISAGASSRTDCYNCFRLNVECIWPASTANTGISVNMPLRETLSPVNSVLLTRTELFDLVEIFFSGPYHFVFLSFIHRSTFLRQLHLDPPTSIEIASETASSRMYTPLLLVIAAIALRFGVGVNHTVDARPDTWIEQAKHMAFQQSLRSLSLSNLMTLILLAYYDCHTGKSKSAWILSGMAFRTTQAFQLQKQSMVPPCNVEQSTSHQPGFTSPFALEIQRRLMWSCFALDSALVGGDEEVFSVPEESLQIDPAFDEINPQPSSGFGQTSSENNLLTNILRLLALRRSIHVYIMELRSVQKKGRRHADGRQPDPDGVLPWHKDSPYHYYESLLDDWEESLPLEHRLNSESLSGHTRSKTISAFLSMHLMYHSSRCLLSRFHVWPPLFTPENGRQTSVDGVDKDFLEHSRLKRVKHACEIANILIKSESHRVQVNDSSDNTIELQLDPFIALPAYQSFGVLIREIEYSVIDIEQGWTREKIAERLRACLRCLLNFSTYMDPPSGLLKSAFIFLKHASCEPVVVQELSQMFSFPAFEFKSRAGTPDPETQNILALLRAEERASEDQTLYPENGETAPSRLASNRSPEPIHTAAFETTVPGNSETLFLEPKFSGFELDALDYLGSINSTNMSEDGWLQSSFFDTDSFYDWMQ